MNAYRFAIHRTVIGFAALTMTALTLALSVVVPAALTSQRDAVPAALAGTNASDRAAKRIDQTRVDVVGVRARATAFAPAPRTLPKQDEQEG